MTADLDARVYEAFDAMGPAPEVEARVLEALRAEQDAAVTHRGPRLAWLAAALPLAACLAVAVVLLRPQAQAPQMAEAPQVTAEESKAVSAEADDMAYEAEDNAMAESYEAPMALADAYPVVVLESGQELRVGERYDGEVDASAAVAAEARSDDGALAMPCEVVEGHYVRYDGDDTWYALHE